MMYQHNLFHLKTCKNCYIHNVLKAMIYRNITKTFLIFYEMPKFFDTRYHFQKQEIYHYTEICKV